MKAFVTAAATAVLCSIAAWATAVPASPPEERESRLEAATPAPAPPDTGALRKSTARLRQHNPFRLDRKPADVRYNPWEPVAVAAPPPAPPRPPLALAGLIGGPPWSALVEGIPGREGGVLLQAGDSVNGIRLVAIRGDTAVLSGFDTTWALTARRAWR